MREQVILFGFINTLFVQLVSYLRFKPTYNFNPFNMIYLTTQINFIQFIYFLISFISIYFVTFNFNRFTKLLSSLHLIYGSLIAVSYHIVGVIEKEIELTLLSKIYTFWTHGFVFFLALLDVYLMTKEHGNFLKFKDILPYILSYDLMYTIWSYYCFIHNGKWPYDVLNRSSFLVAILLQSLLIAFSFIFAYISCVYAEYCHKIHQNPKNFNKRS